MSSPAEEPGIASVLVPCHNTQHHSKEAYVPSLNGLYRDTLWTEGIRCAGTEQLAFFKALKQLKGLMGTTEHLKGVRTSISSWVPATH